jgi:hypothetical protein
MSEKKYISYNYLGHLGRLGNQMFQYAAFLGIAKYHEYDYFLPPNTINHIHLYECFELDNVDKKIAEWSSFERVSPSLHTFDQKFFNDCPSSADLLGFFQTEKYFLHIKEEIKEHYTFKKDIVEESRRLFSSLFYDNRVISLHIRVSDNKDHSIMKPVDLNYYEKSLSCFDKNLPVLIVSDDIEYCKKQNIFFGSRFSFSNAPNQFVDLCIMTMCKYHIISNSTFAWWGAWLSDSNKVIAPKKWYNDYVHNTKEWHEISQLTWNPYEDGIVWESKDVCPDEWILI